MHCIQESYRLMVRHANTSRMLGGIPSGSARKHNLRVSYCSVSQHHRAFLVMHCYSISQQSKLFLCSTHIFDILYLGLPKNFYLLRNSQRCCLTTGRPTWSSGVS